LRRQHLTYREIGAELGIDLSTAFDAVQRAAQIIPTEGAAETRPGGLTATQSVDRARIEARRTRQDAR